MATVAITPEVIRDIVSGAEYTINGARLEELLLKLQEYSEDFTKPVYLVTQESFNSLIEDRDWRIAMESAGVDNWSGYGDAMDELEAMNA